MKDIDHLALDGRSLQLFLAVLETESVTAAAARLGITQSAVSHSLDRLRRIFDDPLFVKSGRGIVATARAEALEPAARDLLARMKDVVSAGQFDPGRISRRLVIAANDFQRDLLLPPLFRQLRRSAPELRLQIVPSGLAPVELLRKDKCDLVITAFPPRGSDILQQRLLSDEIVCFYDPQQRPPPADARQFADAEHIGVDFDGSEKGRLGMIVGAGGRRPKVAVVAPNFAGIAPFLRGSRLISCLPRLMRLGQMRGFAWAPLPEPIEPVSFYVAWHLRERDSAINHWIRKQLFEIAANLSGRPSTERRKTASPEPASIDQG